MLDGRGGVVDEPLTHILNEQGAAYCGERPAVMVHGGLNVATCAVCVERCSQAEGIARCERCGWFHDERAAWFFHAGGARPRN